MNLLEVVQHSATFLQKHGIENPKRSAEEVIADALNKRRLDLYLQFEMPLNVEELAKCREVVKRRATGEPAAYIAGQVEFAGVTLEVDRSVLIPRPETEILIEKMGELEGVVWDVCTGSGAIGIALKKRFPHLTVVMSDIGPLDVAKRNAHKNGVDVEILQGDLLQPFEGKCDFLVSNPPYVIDYLALSKEVREFEPRLALEGGYHFYERLAQSKERVRRALFLELGAKMGQRIVEIFEGGVVEPDWAGHDRFFTWRSKCQG
ncbi:MAG: Release factor glutamine methyltransferase [Chlamydiales bacterium]|nr:Release factor glutamine methyltransferase [Chlamydiales bacterium]MCH9634842.1 Release factor glutamine methyltransferase [Chlamydiales bacterium]MCH9703663.1 peptide chain release factor N(5)-glutamine methyltransferase [Chlamydiota bacterium]